MLTLIDLSLVYIREDAQASGLICYSWTSPQHITQCCMGSYSKWADKKILMTSEVQMLRAIYERTTIELGEEAFKPNIGVAQGSIISPYLFNIYSEELLLELEEQGWRAQELCGYADDHLVQSGSVNQLRLAIEVVKEWSSRFDISLNPLKSGILEIPP